MGKEDSAQYRLRQSDLLRCKETMAELFGGLALLHPFPNPEENRQEEHWDTKVEKGLIARLFENW
jgi:hypothetical protein